MKKRRGRGGAKPGELRSRAETRLAGRKRVAAPGAGADPERLVHELEVHQIELELQNEELRGARMELEATLERYTELFDFAPIGYVTLSSDRTIREVNLAGARLLGRERKRLLGRAFTDYVACPHRQGFLGFLSEVLTGAAEDKTSRTRELTLTPASSPPVEVQATAVFLEGPSSLALVALVDLTERKRAEAALRQEIQHRDGFLAALSHELRNPLAPIRSGLYVLERAAPGSEEARRVQVIMERQVGQLTRIIDDLLDVTRIARGKVSLKRERLELEPLVRRSVDDHRPVFEAAGVVLDALFGRDRLWVEADATRLTQVLGNLLANAVKFTPRGGRVEVSLRSKDGQALLSVRDNGVGIASEMRARLFEPFSQAPQTLARGLGGLGLGLATVKGLVELHGGSVELASEGAGRGSDFTVRLPLEAAPLATKASEEAAGVRRHRLLIIEDNQDAAESLRSALELGGHEVRVAHEGEAGIELARSFQPEIVLCDIGLPGMDGYEVARALRREDGLRGSHLIALSGYALPEDLRRASEAGYDRHVAKPPRIDKLERLFSELAGAKD